MALICLLIVGASLEPTLKSTLSLSACSQETVIGFLSRIRTESERLVGETDAFTTVLAKFTDESCPSIKAAGRLGLSEVLRERERILNQVAARWSVRVAIATSMIRNVIRRLSLHDGELDAASRVVVLLGRLQERLEKTIVIVVGKQP
jgi:hypothetical protein